MAVVAALLLAEAGRHAARNLAATWPPRRGDFEAYYWAGRRLDAGGPADLAGLYDSDARDPVSDRRIKDFKNVPVVGAAFVPLSRLEYETAWKAWWIASALAFSGFLAAATLWIRGWLSPWPLPASAVVSAAVHYFPLRDAFDLGQTTQLVTLLLFLGYVALARRSDRLAGVLLALAALVKVPLFLLGLLLLLTRRWRALAAFAILVVLTVAASLLLYGPEVHRAFLGDVIGPHAGSALTALNNQSLVAQLARLWGEDPLHSYRPSPLPALLAVARWMIVAAVLVAWIRARRRPKDRAPADRAILDLDFVMALAVMPLLSPVFWIHYFLLSLPALLLLSRYAVTPGAWPLRAALAASYLLAAWYPPADSAWYGRAPGFWEELVDGRFLYSSFLLAASCFIAVNQTGGEAGAAAATASSVRGKQSLR